MARLLRFVLVLLVLVLLVLVAWRVLRPSPEPATGQPTPAAGADASAQSSDPAAQRIEADLRRLAADDMEGRQTGTPGFERAAAYVAAQLAAIAGLEPAGDDGSWFQRVPLLQSVPERADARLDIHRDGRTHALRFGDQFLPWADFHAPQHDLTAPAAFVGHAIHAPDLDHDDFAGIDLDGRIAVLLPGAPEAFEANARAFHSALREKLQAVAARGAVGVVVLSTPQSEARLPWARLRGSWDAPAMRLRGADGRPLDGLPQLRALAAVGVTAAEFLLDGPDRTAAQVFDAARDGRQASFALAGEIRIAGRSRIQALDAHNVVARLPGRDPALADEHVVHTAHLDHVGLGAAGPDGDGLHNGALDNALGVAIMLEAARTLAGADAAPRRSQVFAALTGEEQGLLGAQWFVAHPTVPRAGLVANLNIDMPILLAPSTDVVAIGASHSTLQAAVEAAADQVGAALSDDPFPEEVTFVRSDQYAFVQAGIPAVYLDGGVISADGEREPKLAALYFLRNCYHQPCDDAGQPIQYDDAARMARWSAAIATLVGDDDARPAWVPGDFFGDRFGGP